MKKFALFVFNPDPMCFIHVLLNALDMKSRGHDCQIVMEGASVKLIPELISASHPLNSLWHKVIDQDLVAGVCRACAGKMGTLDAALSQDLTILDDMSGHPSMAGFKDNDFEIITF